MDELAKQFASLAEKYGPTVAEAAKAAATIGALSKMVGGLMWFVVAGVFYAVGAFCLRKRRADQTYDGEPWCFGIWLGFGAAVVCAIPGIWTFIDPWTWTALNHPELWIAKKAIGL